MSGDVCRCGHWYGMHFESDGSGVGCATCPCKRHESAPAQVESEVAAVCPFCAGHPNMADEVTGPLPFRVVCECGAAGQPAMERAVALGHWNRRYASSTLERENAELRAALVDLINAYRPLVVDMQEAVIALPRAVCALAAARKALGRGHGPNRPDVGDVVEAWFAPGWELRRVKEVAAGVPPRFWIQGAEKPLFLHEEGVSWRWPAVRS